MRCIMRSAYTMLPFIIITLSYVFDTRANAFQSPWFTNTIRSSRMMRIPSSRNSSSSNNNNNNNIARYFNHCHLNPQTQYYSKQFMSAVADPTDGSSSTTNDDNDKTPPSDMKLRDIQAELKEMKVSYKDCFDRESLVRRLEEARKGEIETTTSTMKMEDSDSSSVEETSSKQEETTSSSSSTTTTTTTTPETPKTTSSSSNKEFNREATLTELRSLRVSELRTRLASRQIRWANMIEKEDLVQALCNSLELSSRFSPSGALTPGECIDITGEQLTAELSSSSTATTPLLLDVYATWCGPCKMMAPQMKMAAQEMGEKCRVAKIDSDLNQEWAAKLRVEGLPTVIVFDENGKEVGRREGLLMKSNLVDLVQKQAGI